MPSSSNKPLKDLSGLDHLDAFSAVEPTTKVKSNKKNKKKNEIAAVAEQSGQEKATESIKNEGYCPESTQTTNKMADRDSPSSPKNPFLSNITSNPANNYKSPVFAALGDVFRERAFERPQEDTESESVSTSPQRQGNVLDQKQPSPSPLIRPVPSGADEIRGGFSHHSPPATSPRLPYRQIARRPSGYQYQVDSLATSPRGRPVSMPSHMFHLPSPSGFNLNQMRGMTNDPLGEPSRSTSRKASKYNFMALDSLFCAGDATATPSDNILLTAYENSLQVFHLGKDRASRIGKLDSLRGYVVSAKIIPSPNRNDPLRSIRPLVAVIVHGPEVPGEELSRPSSRHSDQSFDPSYPHDARAMPTVTKYQTTVEVYSLKQHAHVATLFATTSEEARIDNVFGKKSFEPPGPIGSLSIHATGSYVAVASTESGEIYLYDIYSNQTRQQFRCIGKTWTSIPPRKTRTWSSSSAPEHESGRDRSPTRQRYEAPLLALQGRLLAYVPPIASSRSTIFGRVKLPNDGKEAPGLRSHTASSQPQSTCQVETPLDGSMVNEFARGMTQEMLKGAKWVGDQGMQAWKSYWSPKSQDSNLQHDQIQQNQQFPPTHASDNPSRVSQQQTVVSFLDLDKLGETQGNRPDTALQPIASFILPGGCSFMDLSPSGLGLLTASAKGDVQNVWDLMQILYPRLPSSGQALQKGDSLGIIRQIARFTRVTTACIVDVAWLGSRGTKLAIVTDRGTVHLHDLPTNALDWPPREIRRTIAAEAHASEPTSQSASPAGWSSAFSAVSSGAQSISAAVRSNPLAQFSNFNLAQASAGAGAKGGKIVAAGISRSVEAASGTVSSIMSMGETRLHIPGASKMVYPGSARWWNSKEGEAIAVVGDGIVRVHKVLLKKESKQGKKKYSVVGERIAEFAIAEPREKRDTDWDVVNDGFDITGEWLVGPQARKHSRSRSVTNPLSSAEIETNAPFQPLYSDHRIDFETYTDASYLTDGSWAFGQPIASESLNAAPLRGHESILEYPTQDDKNVAALIDPALVNQIEEALPISESPPKSKNKKKKSKSKASNQTAELADTEFPPWSTDLEAELDDNNLNDLMKL